MNYNQNTGMRNPPTGIRKMKHVGDTNVMGISSPPAPSVSTYMSNVPSASSTYEPTMISDDMGYVPSMQSNNYNNGGMPVNYAPAPPNYPSMSQAPATQFPSGNVGGMTSTQFPSGNVDGIPLSSEGSRGGMFAQNNMGQFGMFQQPIVQDMAMQYGQKLADQGKQIVEDQLERWISVSKLKYYFAVDNRYVINKIRLLFFPFVHKDWSLKYDQEKPVQPRYDINAPDLYIPAMAYITYVVVAGLMLGLQKRFSPEQLSIQASSAFACSIFELIVYSITLYVSNIKTSLKTLDLVAFTGYKYVIIVACLLISCIFHGFGYYMSLLYCSLSLGFFLLRTLRTKVLQDSTPTAATGVINYDPYGNPQQLDYRGGRKRKLYFLFLIVGGQAFLSFLLSKHLYFRDATQIIKSTLDSP